MWRQVFSTRRLMLVGAVVVVLLLGFSVLIVRNSLEVSRRAYYFWWTGSMVSDAIANGETQELHTFADLRPAYERVCKERGRPWEFEQIEREVLVDFELIQSVAKGDVEITKDHVFLKSKTGSAIVSWQGIDADGMISKALARSKLDKIKVTGTD